MSSHKAKTMARYRLVNGIHVMKSFPNAAQVVNSMSWFQPTEVSSTPQTKARLPAHAWHNMLLVWVYLTSHCVIALIGSPHGCPVLPASANMALLGRLSAQCAAIRFSYYVHYILCRTHAWNILTDLQGSMQMILWMQNNGAWMLCMHCIYLQLHKARRLSWK